MYQEHIATYTRDLLSEDITQYLASEAGRHGDDRLVLNRPTQIDLAALIGGIVGVEPKTLPQYALDCSNKTSGTEFDQYEFIYTGQLSFMVGAADPLTAERLAKRHAATLERWVRVNRFLTYNDPNGDFKIVGLMWTETVFMGTAEASTDESEPFWLCGGTLSLAWQVFESGDGDVATGSSGDAVTPPDDSSSGGIQKATVTLSSADILDLHNTPVTLVAAPGADEVIAVSSWEAWFRWGASFYSLLSDPTIAYASGPTIGTLSYNLGGGQDSTEFRRPGEVVFAEPSDSATGKAVVATVGDAITDGDSTLVVVVHYSIEDVP